MVAAGIRWMLVSQWNFVGFIKSFLATFCTVSNDYYFSTTSTVVLRNVSFLVNMLIYIYGMHNYVETCLPSAISSGYELFNRHLRAHSRTKPSLPSIASIKCFDTSSTEQLISFMMKSILSFVLLALAIASTSAFGVYTPVVSQSSSVSVGMID
jgi:hypothetical protein